MAAREIMQWDFVDPARISIWGWSGGGATTLNAMFRYPEIYSTGIAVAAVSDLHLYDNIYQERYMGLPEENEEAYFNGSPVNFAENLQGNLLVIHGTGDDNVHYQNAEVLVDALVAANKQFSFMAYPNRSHAIYERKNTRLHLYTTLFNFLKNHNLQGAKNQP
jgi:dipeptidyl-peptidase-4